TFDQDQIDAKGNVTLDSVFYNKRSLGNLALDVNYESSKQVGQWAYASVNLDDKRILEGDLNLNSADSVQMAAHLFLYALPLKLADPFIPEAMASLTGSASGDLTMEKLAGQPLINGKVDLDSAAVLVSYANATYKFDEQPLVIKDNKLHFSNYEVKAYNNNPLVINGDFNFTDFNRMTADLRITGGNVELLNVKKQRGQMIYGRLVMNVNTTVKGPLNFLKIRGGINLLGGTNVNYVMLDSPVSAQNRVSNLVTFTSFNDTIDSNYKVNVQPVSLSGIDMLVTVNIAPSVQVGIDLSTNGDDRVELQGGGDLAFRLTPMGETDLSGRYALTGGFVRYNMPILPVAKTFNIQNGSYVEWSGQLMDPYINITASENIRTTVTEEGKGSRVVLFMPMIEIKNRLDDLSVTFTLQAPNDPTIQTQIAQMTPEERSRQAMNLIIMQSYTGPGTSAKASTSNALNAFIQKEINSFAGSALKGIDLSVGIDQYNTDGQAGSSRTDYSFRFSKKLFNDRFRIVVGGTVSSGQEVESSQQQSFIDDIVLEYMLDKTGTRYVKLFHQTGFESVLEGEIVETGIGVVLKRRVRKVRQLFIFNEKKRKQAIYAEPEEAKQPDSEATEKQGQQEMEGEKATPHNGKKTEE
ncbi:MAG: translocation/assembly module TamB domain-containing protein, partial [Bacteroidales bacterium]